MMKLIFWGILIYLLYKLVVNFIIPVSRATRQVKSKIRQAQEQHRFQEQQQQQYARQQEQAKQQESPAGDKEYIDFEEVK